MRSFQPLELLRSIFELSRDREISFLGGSIAFFAFVSLIPAMVLVLWIGSVLGGERFAQQVVSLVEGLLSQEGSQVVSEALMNTGGLAGLSALSGLVLLWSTLKVFRAVDVAFNRVYDAAEQPPLPTQLLHGLVVLFSIGAGIGLLVFGAVILGRLPLPWTVHLGLFKWALVLPGLLIVLTPLYYVMPPGPVTVRDILPGTFTAVVGIMLLQELFGLYAANAQQYQAYGFVGAVLLFLLWLYFGSMIVLFGAVVNAALEQQNRPRHTSSENDTEGNGKANADNGTEATTQRNPIGELRAGNGHSETLRNDTRSDNGETSTDSVDETVE